MISARAISHSEQEALSHRYHACHILHLSTGEYAVFNNSWALIYIGSDPLSQDLRFTPPAVKPKLKFDLTQLRKKQ